MIQATSPEMYRDTLLELCTHHVIDEHEWEGGHCSFHDLQKCACGNGCENGNECPKAIRYTSANVLSCPFHLLAYRIVMTGAAKRAEEVIHSTMGRGHSNPCESRFPDSVACRNSRRSTRRWRSPATNFLQILA